MFDYSNFGRVAIEMMKYEKDKESFFSQWKAKDWARFHVYVCCNKSCVSGVPCLQCGGNMSVSLNSNIKMFLQNANILLSFVLKNRYIKVDGKFRSRGEKFEYRKF